MYVDVSKSQGKYTRYLLRESYRENGKVKHRTIANLSLCSEEEIVEHVGRSSVYKFVSSMSEY